MPSDSPTGTILPPTCGLPDEALNWQRQGDVVYTCRVHGIEYLSNRFSLHFEMLPGEFVKLL